MTTLRKLELAGGILTAAIGTYVGLTLIYLDYQTSQRHAEPFPIESGVFFFLIYLLPPLAIFFGSYLHAVIRKQLGQFLLIVGALVNVVTFALLILSPYVPYGRLDLFWLSLLSFLLAIITTVLSVFVQKEGRRRELD